LNGRHKSSFRSLCYPIAGPPTARPRPPLPLLLPPARPSDRFACPGDLFLGSDARSAYAGAEGACSGIRFPWTELRFIRSIRAFAWAKERYASPFVSFNGRGERFVGSGGEGNWPGEWENWRSRGALCSVCVPESVREGVLRQGERSGGFPEECHVVRE
jgi:hypothetical protein